MVPAYFVLLDKLPLTPNGKIDRKRLPKPGMKEADEYEAPKNEIEIELAGVWADVLGINREMIGMNSDFFKLGGHSLKAAAVTAKVQKTLNINVPLVELFRTPTIRDLAQWIIAAGKNSYAYAPIRQVEEKEYYDASHAQGRVWAQCQVEAASISYNMPFVQLLEGKSNIPALEQTLQTLVARHESLRTVFLFTHGEVKQKILQPEHVNFNVEHTDLEGVLEKETKVRELVEHHSGMPFDLSTGPLLKVRLIRLEEHKHVFFFNMHHIISDFLSFDVFIDEMLTLYDAFEKRTPNPLKPLPIQYKDYAAWHNEQLKGKQLTQHREYWLKQLTGKPTPLELPLDYQRPAVQTYNGDRVKETIAGAFFKKLKTFSDSHQVTLFMTLLTTLNLLFYYYTGQTDIVLGAVIAGREHADLQDQIGFYLNTLALRTRFDPGDTFAALLVSVKTVLTKAFTHQVYPFDQLLEDLGETRDRARHPIFDVLVDMVNYNPAPGETLDRGSSSKVQVKNFGFNRSAAKFDLTIYFIEGEDTLNVRFEYNTDLFARKTIKGMVERFGKLLETVLENPGSIISDLKLKQKRQAPIIQRISRKA
jgi:acyl carrier protein